MASVSPCYRGPCCHSSAGRGASPGDSRTAAWCGSPSRSSCCLSVIPGSFRAGLRFRATCYAGRFSWESCFPAKGLGRSVGQWACCGAKDRFRLYSSLLLRGPGLAGAAVRRAVAAETRLATNRVHKEEAARLAQGLPSSCRAVWRGHASWTLDHAASGGVSNPAFRRARRP